MNKLKILSCFAALLCVVNPLFAQEVQTIGNYNYHDTFGPSFYTKNGNEFRSAGGQPGPKYWQNRADYKLTARLNEQNNEISEAELADRNLMQVIRSNPLRYFL